MKKLLIPFILLSLILSLSGCSSDKDDAKAVLESYVQNIADSNYEAAYELLSDFDKDNISKELFVNWQTAVSKVQKIENFSISKKTDKFKNYEYMGYKFGKAYGLEVNQTLDKLIPDIKWTGYESDSYKILVSSNDGEYRIILLVTKMEANLEQLNKALSEKETESK